MEKYSQANDNPVYVAKEIAKVISIMINRMPYESRPNSYRSVRDKLKELNVIELSNKKSPGGASIGVSISLIKNMLNGRDPYFIRSVIMNLAKYLK
tara:strand:- start:49 stop:336 length:288 start_codon:yes stop_codon:yes gene_type:complete